MRLRQLRGGVTLLELLVATGIAGVLSLAAVSVLRQTGRAATWRAVTSRAESVAQEALAVAGTLIESSLDARVIGDTAVDIVSVVMDAVPCHDGAVAPLSLAGPSPEPGDRWMVLERSAPTGGTDAMAWRSSAPMRVLEARDECGALDSMHPLVRVTSRVRLVPYLSSDGSWMVGLRRCADRCEAPQPLVGPIRAPTEGGWLVRAAPCGVEVGVRPLGAVAVRRRLVHRC